MWLVLYNDHLNHTKKAPRMHACRIKKSPPWCRSKMAATRIFTTQVTAITMIIHGHAAILNILITCVKGEREFDEVSNRKWKKVKATHCWQKNHLHYSLRPRRREEASSTLHQCLCMWRKVNKKVSCSMFPDGMQPDFSVRTMVLLCFESFVCLWDDAVSRVLDVFKMYQLESK